MIPTLLVAALLAAAPGGEAQRPCTPSAPGETFAVDLHEVPLRDLARLVSCAAELNIAFQPPALGDKRVTVIATRPVPLRELIRLFEHTAVRHGLEIETKGAFRFVRRADR